MQRQPCATPLSSARRTQPRTDARGPLLRHGFAATVRTANTEVLLMAQIETQEAVKNLEDIASVAGIDCLFVGPNDLASTYGLAFPACGKRKTSEYWKAIARCPRSRAGTAKSRHPSRSPETANEASRLGYTLVGIGVDAGFLWSTARRVRSEVNATASPAPGG